MWPRAQPQLHSASDQESAPGLEQDAICSLTLALFGAIFLDGGEEAVTGVLNSILDWPDAPQSRPFKCDSDLFDIAWRARCSLEPWGGWTDQLHLASEVLTQPDAAAGTDAAGPRDAQTAAPTKTASVSGSVPASSHKAGSRSRPVSAATVTNTSRRRSAAAARPSRRRRKQRRQSGKRTRVTRASSDSSSGNTSLSEEPVGAAAVSLTGDAEVPESDAAAAMPSVSLYRDAKGRFIPMRRGLGSNDAVFAMKQALAASLNSMLAQSGGQPCASEQEALSPCESDEKMGTAGQGSAATAADENVKIVLSCQPPLRQQPRRATKSSRLHQHADADSAVLASEP